MAKRLLRKRVTLDRTGLSTSQLYEGMKDGTFPASVPIGRRTVGWVEEEVEEWIEGRIKLRNGPDYKRRRAGPGRGHKAEDAIAAGSPRS